MAEAIFLSASVPDPERGPEYAKTADSVAIAAAVSALVYVTLGRRPLIWGGHPAITPIVWVVAEDFGVEYADWVTLYQTEYFRDEFPEDNARFNNVVFTPKIENDRDKSLYAMREAMFGDNNFSAAIFIGGMKGIIDEFELFQKMQPNAIALPIASTGGAVIEVASKISGLNSDLSTNLDYVSLFHKHLHISPKEQRYHMQADQPANPTQRYRKFPSIIKPTSI